MSLDPMELAAEIERGGICSKCDFTPTDRQGSGYSAETPERELIVRALRAYGRSEPENGLASIQRYARVFDEMIHDPDGRWVRYSDVASLFATNSPEGKERV